MRIDNGDVEKLKELEESMWRSETRFDREYMERILSPDFFEFGRSGRIYKRKDTLAAPSQEIGARLPLKDFKVHQISDNVVLVTYVSIIESENVQIGNRSSIWMKTDEGWKLRFHQGTPVIRDNIDR
jgi:hypothetical protein